MEDIPPDDSGVTSRDSSECFPPLPTLSIQRHVAKEQIRNSVQSNTARTTSQVVGPLKTSSIEGATEPSSATGDSVVCLDDSDRSDVPVRTFASIFLRPPKTKEDASTAKGKKPMKKRSRGTQSKKACLDLTAWKLTGAPDRKEVVSLLTDAKDVVTYSPGSRKRSRSPLRLSQKRSRSPSPNSPNSSPKKSVSVPSGLLICQSSPVKFTGTRTAPAIQHDFAPFTRLVHIDHLADDEWYNSVRRHEVKPVSSAESVSAPSFRGVYSSLLSGGSNHTLSGVDVSSEPVVMDHLASLEEQYPKSNIPELFQRYCSATRSIFVSTSETGKSGPLCSAGTERNVRKKPKLSRRRGRTKRMSSASESLELKCSIAIEKQVDSFGYVKVVVKSISASVGGPPNTSSDLQMAPKGKLQGLIDLCSPERPSQPTVSSSNPINRGTSLQAVNPPLMDQWTDCLSPGKASDVLGNLHATTAMVTWLKEWKEKMGSPAQSERTEQLSSRPSSSSQENCPKQHKIGILDTSDSDFESPIKVRQIPPQRDRRRLADSDDDWLCDDSDVDDDDGPSKVMLITGPIGSGKTAAVYACAKELGFNVIEMNASSQRSRQQVISQLMEASQSHQVVKSSGPLSSYFTARKNSPVTASEKTERKASTKGVSLTSFFKPKNASTSEIKVASTSDASLNKASVLLLEDVDVLFEEHDKGFWSSVYEVVRAARKPIILTSSDPTLELTCGYLDVSFCAPSKEDISVQLQVLSLSQGVLLSSKEADLLVKLFDHDMRRCLLTLQLWLASPLHRTGSGRHDAPTSSGRPSFSHWLLCCLLNANLQTNPVAPFPSLEGHLNLKTCNVNVIDTVYNRQLQAIAYSSQHHQMPSGPSKSNQPGSMVEQLRTLHQLADQMSELDVLLPTGTKFEPARVSPWWRTAACTSLLDEEPEQDTSFLIPLELLSQIVSHCEALAQSHFQHVSSDLVPHASPPSPVDIISDTIDSVHRTTKKLNRQSELWDAASPLFSPVHNLSRRQLVLDVLPTLGTICFSEQNRREAKAKRRFSHYFHHSPIDISRLDSLLSPLCADVHPQTT